MKPILKWAGGKRQLLNKIKELMPKDYNRYIEPFCGGAALFFDLQPQNAILNDKNASLINCYKQIRDNRSYVKRFLNKFEREHTETKYYELRELFNWRRKHKTLNSVDAALMIYLNKAGFNGMYRENANGDFNIPSGKRESVNLYDNQNFNECAELLKHANIMCEDFAKALLLAEPNDFVFIDSPYDNSFHQYNKGGFTRMEHERLARVVHELTAQGVHCMLTNYDTPLIRELYPEEIYHFTEVSVRRMISYTKEKQLVTELIIRNY